MSDIIDLRSDTVTRPTPQMRQAMADAPVGDDVYGEDPTVRALEERFAREAGKPAGLYLPTGTMSNQVALRCHTQPGDAVVCVRDAHLVLHETGGAAALAGVSLVEAGVGPGMSRLEFESRIYPDDIHYPQPRLAWLEVPHTQSGGRLVPLADVAELSQVAWARGMKVHIDGARLHNALVATSTQLRDWGALCDSLCICLCKGLGAPAGSLLAGSHEFIRRARRVRKLYGGGMRQVGILAAAGSYALDHHVERLADDHARARKLAQGLEAGLPPEAELQAVETNSVVVAGVDASLWVERARSRGVLSGELDPRRVRLMTHLGLDDALIDEAIERLSDGA